MTVADPEPVPDWYVATRADLDAWLAESLGPVRWSVRHARPWSVVGRVDPLGPWIKATHPASRHEVAVLETLAGLVPGSVPEVVAADRARGWLVLADGGPVLRTLEGGADVAPTWGAALHRYARIQRAAEVHADDLVAAGVPDVRGIALLDRLDDLVADDELVGRGRPWGLTPDDEHHLERQRPQLRAWVDELAASPVAATIQHDDLHGNNVFVTGPRIFDWGDAVVSHPFATMTATLRSIPHHSPGLRDGLDPLVAAYLAEWSDVADPTRLRRDLQLARHLGAVMRAMAWARALGGSPDDHPDREATPGWITQLLAPLPDQLPRD